MAFPRPRRLLASSFFLLLLLSLLLLFSHNIQHVQGVPVTAGTTAHRRDDVKTGSAHHAHHASHASHTSPRVVDTLLAQLFGFPAPSSIAPSSIAAASSAPASTAASKQSSTGGVSPTRANVNSPLVKVPISRRIPVTIRGVEGTAQQDVARSNAAAHKNVAAHSNTHVIATRSQPSPPLRPPSFYDHGQRLRPPRTSQENDEQLRDAERVVWARNANSVHRHHQRARLQLTTAASASTSLGDVVQQQQPGPTVLMLESDESLADLNKHGEESAWRYGKKSATQHERHRRFRAMQRVPVQQSSLVLDEAQQRHIETMLGNADFVAAASAAGLPLACLSVAAEVLAKDTASPLEVQKSHQHLESHTRYGLEVLTQLCGAPFPADKVNASASGDEVIASGDNVIANNDEAIAVHPSDLSEATKDDPERVLDAGITSPRASINKKRHLDHSSASLEHITHLDDRKGDNRSHDESHIDSSAAESIVNANVAAAASPSSAPTEVRSALRTAQSAGSNRGTTRLTRFHPSTKPSLKSTPPVRRSTSSTDFRWTELSSITEREEVAYDFPRSVTFHKAPSAVTVRELVPRRRHTDIGVSGGPSSAGMSRTTSASERRRASAAAVISEQGNRENGPTANDATADIIVESTLFNANESVVIMNKGAVHDESDSSDAETSADARRSSGDPCLRTPLRRACPTATFGSPMHCEVACARNRNRCVDALAENVLPKLAFYYLKTRHSYRLEVWKSVGLAALPIVGWTGLPVTVRNARRYRETLRSLEEQLNAQLPAGAWHELRKLRFDHNITTKLTDLFRRHPVHNSSAACGGAASTEAWLAAKKLHYDTTRSGCSNMWRGLCPG